MMGDDNGRGLAILLMIPVTGLIVCWSLLIYGFGFSDGSDHQQKAAIKAGVAKWAVNPTTGVKSFEYR